MTSLVYSKLHTKIILINLLKHYLNNKVIPIAQTNQSRIWNIHKPNDMCIFKLFF